MSNLRSHVESQLRETTLILYSFMIRPTLIALLGPARATNGSFTQIYELSDRIAEITMFFIFHLIAIEYSLLTIQLLEPSFPTLLTFRLISFL